MAGASEMKKQFVSLFPCLLFVVVVVILQSTAAEPTPSSPLVANLPASSAGPRDFIQSLCSLSSSSNNVTECSNLLAPYAVSINGSKARAVRGAVTILVAELEALDKRVVEFNRTDGQDYELGPCMKVIHEAAIAGKQQLADLSINAAGDANNQAALAKANTWYDDLTAKVYKCDGEINDVPRSEVMLKTVLALGGVFSAAAGTPK